MESSIRDGIRTALITAINAETVMEVFVDSPLPIDDDPARNLVIAPPDVMPFSAGLWSTCDIPSFNARDVR